MFEDQNILAENKLLLLYTINKINVPISQNQITQIVLENGFLNYFLLQQYLDELIVSKLLEKIHLKDTKNRISITKKGIEVLNLFITRLPEDTVAKIDSYLKINNEKIKKEISLHSDYTVHSNNSFLVNLRAEENSSVLIDINVAVPTKKHAIKLCDKWKSNSSQIYNGIMKLLIENSD
ncbi:DUF4364 family protein [Clostridium oryzae]|uniref:DUF4364 domain-containing protein n=1 Tax=Clostridium oryzae TaxID=1450648 RepID=A0A1V4IEZ8_9CLOT|nr:DUF4364 family protein [Clostridium oryzae]OPJ58506.1 hypothetical protein CLORY_35730 [Clostridium oryzae]